VTTLFLLQVLNGVQLGILLFLVAAGLTLIFGIMDFINIAHGALYMVGAYLLATFAAASGSFWLGLLLALPAMLALGLALEWAIFRRLYDRSHLDQVLATFGLVMIVTEGVHFVWGSTPISVPLPAGLAATIPLFGIIQYPVYRLAIIVVGLAVALGLYLLIGHTRAGMLLRAGASNRPMVAALGVDVGRLFALVFAFGAMLAGFAGAIVAPILSVSPGMGESVLILTFVVIVIGGIGSIKGAFVAALVVGVVDTLGRSFGPILLQMVMEPAAASQTGRTLAPMLALRPAGLFGARAA
jgi:branched-chain amino acid transport system permease protein